MSETRRPSDDVPLWMKLAAAAFIIPIVALVLALLWGAAALAWRWAL